MQMGLISSIVAKSRAMIFVASCIGALAFALTGASAPLDHALDGLRARMMHEAASGNVVVIGLDADSITRIHAWPWPRSIHAELVNKLRAYGARSASFDIDFSSPAADPAQDAIFAAALAKPGINVSLIGVKETGDGPTAPLAAHAKTVTAFVMTGKDSLVREISTGDVITGQVRPALALEAAGQARNAQLGSMPIDWSVDPATIPSYSYADVLAGRVPARALRGKIVLVGATAPTLGDWWNVPVYGRIPGIAVHAVAAETALRGIPIDLGPEIGVAIASILIAFSMRAVRRRDRIALLVLAAVGIVFASWLVRYNTRVIIEAAPSLIAILCAICFECAVGTLKAILVQVTTDQATSLPNMHAMRIASPPGAHTIAVRLRNHVETTALLGIETQATLLQRVHERLKVVAHVGAIYQVGDHSFAWRTNQDAEEVYQILDGLHGLFAAGIQIGDLTIDTTMTAGVSDTDMDVERSVAEAMLAADRAAQHGQRWERYEAEDDANWKATLLSEVDRAIDKQDLWVAYQPKYELASGGLVGAEALVRWTHPTRGFIAPDRFIPILEDADRIERLTIYVLERAIRDFAGIPGKTVAVNLSMRLFGRVPLVETIKALLTKYNMEAARLVLEITESAAITDAAGLDELYQLRDLGVSISIDDYGTGQSTLSYLQMLPASELKIDRSFIKKLPGSRADMLVVDSTIKLAHALGLKVVGEGVETTAVRDVLANMNCDTIQGWLTGKPVPFEDFAKLVSDAREQRAAA